MAMPNYLDSEESFDGFDPDNINNCHDRAIEIGESDLDISSIGSSSDDGSDIKSSFEMRMKAMKLVTCNPVWTTDLENFQVPYFTSYRGFMLPQEFDKSTAAPIDYFRLFYTQYMQT